MPADLGQCLSAWLSAFLEFFPGPDPKRDKRRKAAGRPRGWTWEDVFAIAASAGVDPWSYSLRELLWMANARAMEEWDRVAWLCANMPRFKKVHGNWQDFNPIRHHENMQSVSDMQDLLAEMKGKMPETLTPEEQKRKFQEFCKCQDQPATSGRAAHTSNSAPSATSSTRA